MIFFISVFAKYKKLDLIIFAGIWHSTYREGSCSTPHHLSKCTSLVKKAQCVLSFGDILGVYWPPKKHPPPPFLSVLEANPMSLLFAGVNRSD